jgi:hypothetical protein
MPDTTVFGNDIAFNSNIDVTLQHRNRHILNIAANSFELSRSEDQLACRFCCQGEAIMKTAAIALAAVGLLAAGAASAADRVSDLDYMKASRCKGIAAGLGSDSAGLDAFLKAQGRSRQAVVIERGDAEMTRAKREASKADFKDRTSAELSGPCMAYVGEGKDMAAMHSPAREP